jgi:hypothetical protein
LPDTQPLVVLHVAVLQTLAGVQTTAPPPLHAPLPSQVSPLVQASLSLHAVPAPAGGFEQMPVFVSQVPATKQPPSGWQTIGLVPAQLPLWQASLCVHLLPSSHRVPSVLLGFEQAPVALAHTPTSWHWSLAVHTFGLPPTHAPFWHESVWVHLSPSSQAPVLIGFEHWPVAVLHTPAR